MLLSAGLQDLTGRDERLHQLVFSPLETWDDQYRLIVVLEELGRLAARPEEEHLHGAARAAAAEIEARLFEMATGTSPHVSGHLTPEERGLFFEAFLAEPETSNPRWLCNRLSRFIRSPLDNSDAVSAVIPEVLERTGGVDQQERFALLTSLALDCLEGFGAEICKTGNFPILMREAYHARSKPSKRLMSALAVAGIDVGLSPGDLCFSQVMTLVRSSSDSRAEVEAAIPRVLELLRGGDPALRHAQLTDLATACIAIYGPDACQGGNFLELIREAYHSGERPGPRLRAYVREAGFDVGPKIDPLGSAPTQPIVERAEPGAAPVPKRPVVPARAEPGKQTHREPPARIIAERASPGPVNFDGVALNADDVPVRIYDTGEFYQAVTIRAPSGFRSDEALRELTATVANGSGTNIVRVKNLAAPGSLSPAQISECLDVLGPYASDLNRIAVQNGTAVIFMEEMPDVDRVGLERLGSVLSRIVGMRRFRLVAMPTEREFYIHDEDKVTGAAPRDLLYTALPPHLRIHGVRADAPRSETARGRVEILLGHTTGEFQEIYDANRVVFDRLDADIALTSVLRISDYTAILASWVPDIDRYFISLCREGDRNVLHVSSVALYNNLAGVGFSRTETQSGLFAWLEDEGRCSIRFGEDKTLRSILDCLSKTAQRSLGQVTRSARGGAILVDGGQVPVSEHAIDQFINRGGLSPLAPDRHDAAARARAKRMIIDGVASAAEVKLASRAEEASKCLKHGPARYFYTDSGWIMVMAVSARPRVRTCYPVTAAQLRGRYRFVE